MAGDDRSQGGRRTALVTGASAGIGEAFAHIFAEQGFDLVLAARRRDRLERVAATLERQSGATVHVCPLDLADPTAPGALEQWLAERQVAVDALVNNAGYALSEGFCEATWEAHDAMLRVMGTAPLELCHRLLPGMKARRRGWIINVASLAALAPDVPGSLYGPVKAFLVRATEALSLELAGTGVNVTALCPGFTYSEFHDVMGNRDEVSRLPSFLWMDAQAVAREGFDAVMAGKTVWVNGAVNRAIAGTLRWLPDGVVRSLQARRAAEPQR